MSVLTFTTVPVEQSADSSTPTITSAWVPVQHHRIDTAAESGSWWLRVEVSAYADAATVGRVRVTTSSGAVSPSAGILGLARGVGLGWIEIGSPAQTVAIELQRAGGAGSIRLLSAAATITSDPPSQVPGPHYPSGYTAPIDTDYPVGTLISATGLDQAIALAWSSASVTSWTVQISNDSGATWVNATTVSGTTTATTIVDLLNGVAYLVRVVGTPVTGPDLVTNTLVATPSNTVPSSGYGINPFGDRYGL